MWRLSVGESVRVSAAGDGRDATPRARKARALLAVLAARQSGRASRGDVIALLWSDRGAEQARASLRQCLFELRIEAPGLIEADGEQLKLNANVAHLPLPPQARWLADLDHLDPSLDQWLQVERLSHPVTLEGGRPDAPGLHSRRRTLRAMTLVVVLAAGAGLVAFALRQPPAIIQPVIILAPWRTVPADAALQAVGERSVTAIRNGIATARAIVRASATSVPHDATWIVSGETIATGATASVAMSIRTPAGLILWSQSLQGPSATLARNADRLADWTASTLVCAAGGPRGIGRSEDVTALLMDVCGKDYSDAPGLGSQDVETAARRLLAASPSDPYGHGILAMTLASEVDEQPASLVSATRGQAEAEARRALKLNPGTGEAYMALGQLELDRHDFAAAETWFRRGLAAEPDHPSLPDHVAGVLESVGRSDEALVFARRALARDPTSPIKIGDVADLLARTGQPRAALALLDRAEAKLGPVSSLTNQRLALLLRGGDPAGARAVVERTTDLEPNAAAKLLAQIRAIEDPNGSEARELVAKYTAAGRVARNATPHVLALASLRRFDAALDLAADHAVDPEIFFRAGMRPLLLSPRFPMIARQQGLWRYWRDTGHWPDICRDRALPWRCGTVKIPSIPR